MKTKIGIACLLAVIGASTPAQNSTSTNAVKTAAETAINTLAATTNSVESTLRGRWNVALGSYRDIWTFKEDRTVISANQPDLQGTWKKETNCILIQWDEVEDGCRTWEAFNLPLREEGSRGGNWKGMRLQATKIKS